MQLIYKKGRRALQEALSPNMHPAAKIPHIPYCSYRGKKGGRKKNLTKVINLNLMWIFKMTKWMPCEIVHCKQIKKKITAVLAIKYFCNPPFDCLHCSCTEIFVILWMLQLPVNFSLNSYLIVFSSISLCDTVFLLVPLRK